MTSTNNNKQGLSDNIILKAVGLGQKTGQVFIATADPNGLPHIASAGTLQTVSEHHVEVGAWFCPGTVINLRQNRLIALVVWEPDTDIGYQLSGEVETINDSFMLDGYSPEIESKTPQPQTYRSLLIRIDRVITFSQAPHSDVTEEGSSNQVEEKIIKKEKANPVKSDSKENQAKEKPIDIPVCNYAPEWSEHARFDRTDEPCDDGRIGGVQPCEKNDKGCPVTDNSMSEDLKKL